MSEESYKNTRPCIGIPYMLSGISRAKYGKYFMWQSYVTAIESVGATAILLKINQPESYYKEMFMKINGLLLPGGTSDVYNSPLRKTSEILFKLAKEANDKGDYFPIWGACLGIQLLAVMVAPGEQLVNAHVLKNICCCLDFTEDCRESKLFRDAPDDIIASLRDADTTYNSHVRGVSWEACKKSEAFSDFFRVVSTNVDENGEVFISTMEAQDYPFFAVQWHPEKTLSDKMTHRSVDRSKRGVAICHYLHSFFVDEARKNTHHFYSADEEHSYCMDNYCENLRMCEGLNGKDVMYFFNDEDDRRKCESVVTGILLQG